MWSADPGDATKPPGLFAGVTPIGATTGGGTNAMTDDLGKLFAALAANGGGKTAVIIAAMPQAAKLNRQRGRNGRNTDEVTLSNRCDRIEDDALGRLGIASGWALPITDDDRRELCELCRVHDQMIAEQWANPLERKSDAEGELVFKVMEDTTPAAPHPEPEPIFGADEQILGRDQSD